MREHENELIVGLVSLVPPLGNDEALRRTEALLGERIASPMKTHKRLVEGDRFDAEKTLRELADIIGCDWILTFGGMGPARTDVLPDAVRAVAQKELPGLAALVARQGGASSAERLLMRPAAALRETPKNSTLCMTLPDDFAAAERILTDAEEGFLPALAVMLQKTQGISVELRAAEPEAAEAAPAPLLEAEGPAPAEKPAEEQRVPQAPDPVAKSEPEPAFDPKDILVARPRADIPTELTVVWLHGMGVDNTDFAGFPDELLKFGAPSCRFVLSSRTPLCAKSPCIRATRCALGTISEANGSMSPKMTTAFERAPAAWPRSSTKSNLRERREAASSWEASPRAPRFRSSAVCGLSAPSPASSASRATCRSLGSSTPK